MTLRRAALSVAATVFALGGAAGLAAPAQADTAWESVPVTSLNDTAWE